MALWHNLTVSELASETDGYIRSQTSEPVSVAGIAAWIEANRGEVEAYGLAPHSIACRVLAERDALAAEHARASREADAERRADDEMFARADERTARRYGL